MRTYNSHLLLLSLPRTCARDKSVDAVELLPDTIIMVNIKVENETKKDRTTTTAIARAFAELSSKPAAVCSELPEFELDLLQKSVVGLHD